MATFSVKSVIVTRNLHHIRPPPRIIVEPFQVIIFNTKSIIFNAKSIIFKYKSIILKDSDHPQQPRPRAADVWH